MKDEEYLLNSGGNSILKYVVVGRLETGIKETASSQVMTDYLSLFDMRINEAPACVIFGALMDIDGSAHRTA